MVVPLALLVAIQLLVQASLAESISTGADISSSSMHKKVAKKVDNHRELNDFTNATQLSEMIELTKPVKKDLADTLDSMFVEQLAHLIDSTHQDVFFGSIDHFMPIVKPNLTNETANASTESHHRPRRQVMSFNSNNIRMPQAPPTDLLVQQQQQQQFSFVPQSPLKTPAQVQLSSQSSEGSRIIDAHSQLGISVSQKLNDQFNVRPSASSQATAFSMSDSMTSSVDLSNFQAPSHLCPFKNNKFCNASDRFQSFDGSCNNLKATWLGKTETPYKRYLPVAYDDGIDSPRSLSRLGSPLPNPRVISRALFAENSQFDTQYSHMLGIFGQFLAHDLTSAAISSGGKKIQKL